MKKEKFIHTVAKRHKRISKRLYPLLSKSRITQYLHAFFSLNFYNEILLFYEGKRKFLENKASSSYNEGDLRRNIHRLEKGLIMQPRRETFAKEYILETIENYRHFSNKGIVDTPSARWYADVLSEYFEAVVDNELSIKQARKIWDEIKPAPRASFIELYKPSKRSSYKECNVSYEAFFNLCKLRRSVRWFQAQKVPHEHLEKAVQAALLSPSACNRQPFKFFIFDTKEDIQEIADIPMGTAGFSHQFPAIIVVVGDQSNYEFERDRFLIYIDGSLASMSLMLALETLGLSSCPINWPDMPDLDKIMAGKLRLKSYERPIMLIAAGYAEREGLIPHSAKKTTAEVIIYNQAVPINYKK